MATLNGNNYYIAIDSTNLSAYVIDVSLTPSVAEVDITAGAGATHMERAAGLKDNRLSITFAYDAADIQTYIQKVAPGLHDIEIGTEGATSGKPRHVQSFLITESPYTQNVKKDMVTLTVTATGAAAPTVDAFAGGVYS